MLKRVSLLLFAAYLFLIGIFILIFFFNSTIQKIFSTQEIIFSTPIQYDNLTKEEGKISTVVPSPLYSSTVISPTIVDKTTPDFKLLGIQMLKLINRDRKANHLTEVTWDDFYARIGEAHAQEMANNGYLSHWNLQGYGPDLRNSLAGGYDWIQENVYSFSYQYSNGQPAPIEDWEQKVTDAHASFMKSPGHRANILNPDHTHVGIGFSYNPQLGEFRIAQEFANHYIQIDKTISIQAKPGQVINLQGQLLNGASKPVGNLAYESFPTVKTVNELNQTDSFFSSAKEIQFLKLDVENQQQASTLVDSAQQNTKSKTILYFFWGDGCPFCAKAKLILEIFQKKYPNFELRSYEVWNSSENYKLLQKMATAHGLNSSGVPMVFLGDKYWVGFTDQIGQDYEKEIQACEKTGCMDAGANIIPGKMTEMSFEKTPLPIYERKFSSQVKMGDKPGIYHIRVWVTNGKANPQALDIVIWVK